MGALSVINSMNWLGIFGLLFISRSLKVEGQEDEYEKK